MLPAWRMALASLFVPLSIFSQSLSAFLSPSLSLYSYMYLIYYVYGSANIYLYM